MPISTEELAGGITRVVLEGRLDIEGAADLLDDTRIQNLVKHVPTVLIVSRTVKVSLPEAPIVLYRPVRVAEIVARVSELLARGSNRCDEKVGS